MIVRPVHSWWYWLGFVLWWALLLAVLWWG